MKFPEGSALALFSAGESEFAARLFRIFVFGLFAVEGVKDLLDPIVLLYYAPKFYQMPMVEWLSPNVDIRYLISGRIAMAVTVMLGFAPNVAKYGVFATTALVYNANYVIYFNNHFYLELWLCALSLFLYLPGRREMKERTASQLRWASFFWVALRSIISVIYLHTALVKLSLHVLAPLQLIGFVVDLFLFGLSVMALFKEWFLYLFVAAACLFHLSTPLIFTIGVFPYLMVILVVTSFFSHKLEPIARKWNITRA